MIKAIFQRAGGGEPKLTLGAFGKHPGWDDHIPGIGVETDSLAQVKQTLYVEGIGGQVDAGAWEKMEPERRLDGFDHSFLWLRDGHVIYGQFWSSADGKGRAKYPMVVCVDGQSVTPHFLLGSIPTGLERLREACKAAVTADRVVSDCRAAQEQLRLLLSQNSTRTGETELITNAHRRFLEHPELGPDRLGFLRLLHEMDSTAGLDPKSRADAKSRSRHYRLPLAADTQPLSLGLWAAFLRCAVPEPTSILLLARQGTEWLDAILGQPNTNDFFCLQASPKAVPLVTEIPYHLSPTLKPRLQELELKFAGGTKSSGPTESPQPAVSPPASPVPDSSGATGTRTKTGIWKLFGAFVIIAGIAAAVLAVRARHGPQLAQAPSATPPVPAPAPAKSIALAPEQPPSRAQGVTDSDTMFAAAMAGAGQALRASNYSLASSKADAALQIKPQEPAALKLKQDAQTALTEAVAAADRDRRFTQAMAAAQQAVKSQDYSTALARLNQGLQLRPQDPAAAKLRQTVLDAQAEAARVAGAEQGFNDAFAAAKVAFKAHDYATASARLEEALRLKPKDQSARMLRQDLATAQAVVQADAASKEKAFAEALAAGQAAMRNNDYAVASSKAQDALHLKPADTSALKLAADAQASAVESSRLAASEKEFAASLAAAREALAVSHFDDAEKQVKSALTTKPSDPVAVALLAQVQDSRRQSLAAAIPAPTASASGGKPSWVNSLGMDFVWVASLPDGGAYVSKFEVTQKQFRSVLGRLPEQKAAEEELPVANVTPADCSEFCQFLRQKEGKSYALPTRDEFLVLAGLSADEVAEAWSILAARNAFANEVTSWQAQPPVKLPARGGSRGVGTNGLADVLGNVREWLADGQSAGFSYDAEGFGRRKSLFDVGTNLQAVTGFRCLFREHP